MSKVSLAKLFTLRAGEGRRSIFLEPWNPCFVSRFSPVRTHRAGHSQPLSQKMQQLRETDHAVCKQSQFITLTTTIYSSLTSTQNFPLRPPCSCSLSNMIFLLIKSLLTSLAPERSDVMSSLLVPALSFSLLQLPSYQGQEVCSVTQLSFCSCLISYISPSVLQSLFVLLIY